MQNIGVRNNDIFTISAEMETLYTSSWYAKICHFRKEILRES